MSSSDSNNSDGEFSAKRFIGFKDPNRVSKRQRTKNTMLGVFNGASDDEDNQHKAIKTPKLPLRFQSLTFAKESPGSTYPSKEPTDISSERSDFSANNTISEPNRYSIGPDHGSVNGDEEDLSMRPSFGNNFGLGFNESMSGISYRDTIGSMEPKSPAFNPYISSTKYNSVKSYVENNEEQHINNIRFNPMEFSKPQVLSTPENDLALEEQSIKTGLEMEINTLTEKSSVIEEKLPKVANEPKIISSQTAKPNRKFNPMAFHKPKFNATAFSETQSTTAQFPDTVVNLQEENENDYSLSPDLDSNNSSRTVSGFATPIDTSALPALSTSATAEPRNNSTVPPISLRSTVKELAENGRASARDRHSSPYGLGAKLLAKMGHIAGQGLGAGGSGMVNPIEQKLRPQGLGLGGIKERTKQSIEEARRRGEEVSDSEDENSSKYRKKKEKRNDTLKNMMDGSDNVSVSEATRKTRKSKSVYKTISEMEKEGLTVSPALKSIIDLTGKNSRTLDNLDNFSSAGPSPGDEREHTPFFSLTEQVTDEIEKYGKEWDLLKIRKNYVDFEKNQLEKELSDINSDIARLESLIGLTSTIEKLNTDNELIAEIDNKTDDLSEISDMLQQLELEYPNEFEKFNLEELAIAAFAPIIESNCKNWNPLEHPSFLFTEISGLKRMISFRRSNSNDSYDSQRNNHYHEDFLHGDSFMKKASLFDSMMAQSWFPRVRTYLTNEWNCYHPASAILLIEQWDQVLPSFIRWLLLNQVIFPKIKLTLSEWNPRSSTFISIPAPHKWIFPWLPYFKSHSSASSIQKRIIDDVKLKFGSVLRRWKISSGQNREIIAELSHWKEIFGTDDFDSLLVKNILTIISDYMRRHLVINPANQDLKVINTVLEWGKLFKPTTMALLLKEELMPKWNMALHMWLTSSSGHEKFEEINEWYAQWHDLLPPDIVALSIINDEFSLGLQTIDHALDLFVEDRMDELPKHIIAKSKNYSPKTDDMLSAKTTSVPILTGSQTQVQMTFKDVVEDFCINNDLFLTSLRQAHPTLGHALYKISASPTGHGGLLCYFSEDVVWAQRNKTREYEPISLEQIERLLLG